MSADKFMVRLVDYGMDADLVSTTSERRIQGVADETDYLVVLATDYDALALKLSAYAPHAHYDTLSTALDAALAERDKAYGEVDAMRARVAELVLAVHSAHDGGDRNCYCDICKEAEKTLYPSPADDGSQT